MTRSVDPEEARRQYKCRLEPLCLLTCPRATKIVRQKMRRLRRSAMLRPMRLRNVLTPLPQTILARAQTAPIKATFLMLKEIWLKLLRRVYFSR